MRKAVIISMLLHVGVLAWALGAFTTARRFEVPRVNSVPIDILTPSEFTKIRTGRRDGQKKAGAERKAKKAKKPVKPVKTAAQKPPPKPVARKTVVKKKTKSVKPPAAKTAAVRPKPKKVVKAKPKPKPKPKKLVRAKPKPKPKPKLKKVAKVSKPQPRKNTAVRSAVRRKPSGGFDADRIAALLNKIPEPAGRASRPASRSAPRRVAPPRTAPVQRGRSFGRDQTMSASDVDAFKAQISRCWRPPVGGLRAGGMIVKLRIKINQDGTLSRPPRLINSDPSGTFRAAADSAIRAVWQCQPYDMPAHKYTLWSDMILNFDPRDMYGGY